MPSISQESDNGPRSCLSGRCGIKMTEMSEFLESVISDEADFDNVLFANVWDEDTSELMKSKITNIANFAK